MSDPRKNRWERLRDAPPEEEAHHHVETDDDPLGEELICAGCMADWPCDFERGRRAGAALAALDAVVEETK